MKHRKTILFHILTVTFALMSCTADEMEIPAEELYTRSFIKQFGTSFTASDWNGSTRVKAQIDSRMTAGESTEILIYTSMPGSEGCQLVAQYPAATQAFEFDYDKNLDKAFVAIRDKKTNRYVTYGYYPLRNGTLQVTPSDSRSYGSDGMVPLGELSLSLIDKELYQGYDVYNMRISRNGCSPSDDWWRSLGYDTADRICRKNTSLYQIMGQNSESGDNLGTRRPGNRMTIGDVVPLVGKNGVFAEQQCNIFRHPDVLRPTDGSEFVVTQDNARVSMEYIYGAGTANDRCFGYFYYTPAGDDLNTVENWKRMVSANRYILIWDTNPSKNILDYTFTDGNEKGMELSKAVAADKRSETYTTSIRDLVYYDSEGNPSYNFPAGTHIVFFISSRSDAADKEYIPYYSVPELNEKYGRGTALTSDTDFGCQHGSIPGTVFVTYKWQDREVVGVDDANYNSPSNNPKGNDHDLNDILFYLNGPVRNVRQPDTEMSEDAPKPKSWIIAAEDLGGSYDFDFNDVVFGVSHVSGQETATVTALASGGTLPVYLHSSNPQVDDNGNVIDSSRTVLIPDNGSSDGEFHSWFGADRSSGTIINVSRNETLRIGSSVRIKVDKEKFSMSTEQGGVPNEHNMGGFWITVHNKDYESTITAPRLDVTALAPQMFLVPSEWQWPTEQTNIGDVYDANGFLNWAGGWWLTPSGSKGDERINHHWPN